MGSLHSLPKAIPCAIYAPDREISQVAVVAENVPRALAEMASKMVEHNVNILSGLITSGPGEGPGMFAMFLDLTEADIALDELLEELRALDSISGAEVVVKKVGDMAIDGTSHHTSFLGGRAVVLDVDDMSAMFRWLAETFSSGGNAILFDMGEKVGSSAARRLMDLYGLRGRELVETFLALHVAAGWFSYELLECNEESLVVRVRLHENFECLPLADTLGRPASHLVRGALAGLLKEAYGADFKVVEVSCLAKGDPFCEFLAVSRGERRPAR